jgi:hypothetical protein
MIAAKSLAQTRDLSCRSNASRISTLVKRRVKATLEVPVKSVRNGAPGETRTPTSSRTTDFRTTSAFAAP